MKNLTSFPVKLTALVALILSFSLSSCKKEEGPAGPTGPAGAPGNANVKNMTIFVNANEWVYKPGLCEVTKLVPEITADIVNKGAVMVYTEGTTTGSWDALPTTSAGANLTLAFGYTIEAGKLHLYVTFDSNTTLPGGTLASSNFKLVLIAGSARNANPNVNHNNYEEVKVAYQLAD